MKQLQRITKLIVKTLNILIILVEFVIEIIVRIQIVGESETQISQTKKLEREVLIIEYRE